LSYEPRLPNVCRNWDYPSRHLHYPRLEAGDLCTACAASCCRLLGRGTKMVPAS
jgi:hypothetical protein